MDQLPPLLLHCCCGPCATSSIERTLKEGWQPVLWFDNSNIYPESEADKRYSELQKVALHAGVALAGKGEYDHEAWLAAIRGHENAPEGASRCSLCFKYNFLKTAHAAAKLGIPVFSTTLTVSPYKSSKVIRSIGSQIPGFVFIDFKKQGGYQRSIELSKSLGLYRQRYCGCEFSLRASTQATADSQP